MNITDAGIITTVSSLTKPILKWKKDVLSIINTLLEV